MIELDLSGLNCPLPILRTKQQLLRMQTGEQLRVIATDPHAEIDFKVFLARAGHQLLTYKQENDHFIFIIEK